MLTYSKAQPKDDRQPQKTAQGPQALTLHFGCQTPFLRGILRDFQALTVSVNSVLSVCGYLVGSN